jgi:ubiquinone/menaquinone biosynthesis C-methylase UbiE
VSADRYVPAAGRAAFTRFYDPMMALTMREGTWRPRLLSAVTEALPRGGRVLDVGCGTGTFAIALAAARPDATVVGVDGDPEALAIAAGKTGAAAVTWRQGLATGLDGEGDGGADAVVLSLVLHHLMPGAKRAALAEARRVLRPGGRLHVADWGRPHDPLMRAAFLVLQLVDGFATTREHAAGVLPGLIAETGFSGGAARPERLRTAFGSLELLSATRV